MKNDFGFLMRKSYYVMQTRKSRLKYSRCLYAFLNFGFDLLNRENINIL